MLFSENWLPVDCELSEYLHEVRSAKLKGLPIPSPATVGQLQALYDEWPEIGRSAMPPKAERKRLGLIIAEDSKPLPESFRADIVATLVEDREFAAAVRRVIANAGAA